MKYFKFIFLGVVFAMAISACGESTEQGTDADATEQQDGTDAAATDAAEAAPAAHGEGAEHTSAYVCPMHCAGSGSDAAGKCPACGMDYVAQAEHVGDGHTH